MTDTDKLKRLAEAAGRIDEVVEVARDAAKFMSACSPETILALIAENERLKGQMENAVEACDILLTERGEAVALLREASIMHKDMHEVISACLARIDGNHEPASDANPS